VLPLLALSRLVREAKLWKGGHLSSKRTPKEVAMLEVVVVEKRRRQRERENSQQE